jgi:hypothetical protein
VPLTLQFDQTQGHYIENRKRSPGNEGDSKNKGQWLI